TGRVAPADLGATQGGGIRASVGIPGPDRSVTLPGAPDAGRTELVVANPDGGRAGYQGRLDRTDGEQALGQLQGEVLQPSRARTYEISTPSDSTINLSATA